MMAPPYAGPRPMSSIFAAPRQKLSNSSRRLNTLSSAAAQAALARSASSRHGQPRICEANTMLAAVALVNVLVALPYSGPARIGSFTSTDDQHVLFSLLQSS